MMGENGASLGHPAVLLLQGLVDASTLPLITAGNRASTFVPIVKQLVLLVNKMTAEMVFMYQLSHLDAKIVYFDG